MVRVRRFFLVSLLCALLAGMSACGTSPTAQPPPGSAPVTLNSITVNPASVNGGKTVTATLTLSGPAPSGGAQVVLQSSSGSVTLPSMTTSTGVQVQAVVIPAGVTSSTFKIQTIPVGSTQTVQITATYLFTVTVQTSFTLVSTNPLTIAGFTVSPTSFASGLTLTGTITLNANAFSPGQQVVVASSDPAVQPQSPVTVQTGTASVGFSIFTSPITTQRMVTVTATLNSTSVPVQVTLLPTGTALTSLQVVPFTAAGGSSMTGIVTVSPPAPSGGAVVTLTAAFADTATPSTTPLPVTIPTTVTVPAGATQAQFTVMTSKVTKTTDVTLTATLNSTGMTFGIEVVPSLTLAGISCQGTTVTSGNTIVCEINLSIPAPAGGQTVMLTSTNSTALAVPPSVVVPAGSSVLMLNLVGGAITDSASTTLTATLQGSTTGSVSTTVVTVGINALALTSLALSTNIVQGGAGAAGNLTGTVTIVGAAPPGGLAINLTSSDPSVQFPNGPTVTIPQYATSATFPITTTAVAATVKVTLTAMVTGNLSMVTQSLSVVPQPQVMSISLSPTSVVGGNSSLATVTLNGPAPQFGTTVMIQSSSTDAQAGISVTVPQNATSAIFAVTTLPVLASEVVTITATLGASSQFAMLTITPPPGIVRLLFFNPPSVVTGQNSQGTVTLSAPAPAGGTIVVLTSGAASVTVPNTVTVPAGSTSVSFTASAATGITVSTPVSVSAGFNSTTGTQTSNTLTVIPAQTAAITEQLVVSGETNATDFPTHAANQDTLGAGNDSGFVTSIGLSTPANGTTTSSYTFSTYAGGMSSFGQVRDVFVDSSGNVFGCGVTTDGTLHPTANAAQATYGGGQDAFIVEFNSSGVLQYLSYLGGSGDETCNSLAVDSTGGILVLGSTTNSAAMNANNFMGTTGAFQTMNAGGVDWFVARINPAGTSAATRLVWVTLIGGANDDFGNGRVAVSSALVVAASGESKSTSASGGFPIPPAQGRPSLGGAGTVGVVVGVSADGHTLLSTTLLYGRSLGGNPPDPANPTTTTASGGLAFDANGSIYVCGETNATDLPVTRNAFQPALKGQQNGYIAVLSSSGTIVGMTYLGGTSATTTQACKGIAVDSEMNPVIVMPTDASDYPLVGPGPAALSGPTDIAVTKLTTDLSTIIFSRLVGGGASESADGTRLQLDTAENLYFSLATNSPDFPVTANAVQGTFAGASGGANTNVAVVKLSSDGSTILYGTYLGGSTGTNSTTSVFYHHN